MLVPVSVDVAPLPIRVPMLRKPPPIPLAEPPRLKLAMPSAERSSVLLPAPPLSVPLNEPAAATAKVSSWLPAWMLPTPMRFWPPTEKASGAVTAYVWVRLPPRNVVLAPLPMTLVTPLTVPPTPLPVVVPD